ncbi:flotillin family protein [Kutzneria sp. 744]|uniref:flotillin family protein n=1 Tax=Kutzneria sp. (strain 744) TaxID=345341 RepID=UPI0003EED2EB|nr:flotillin family protein [Kutzneria sp. 744]EWM12704.1 membrane protein [Kutzneria sp. 744]
MNANILAIIGAAVVAVIVLFIILRVLWRVAEPNEAMIISGLGAKKIQVGEDSLGFKIVTGKGTLVLPGFQTARRLSLDTRSAEIVVSCVTKQGIPVRVQGAVIYKVGDDFVSIANAARRFLDQQNAMDTRIHSVFAGHLRSIIGALTVEELIRDRERLTAEVRSSSANEMSKLGLVVDSLQIQEIDDASGYIANLGKPHAAAVAAQARIAEAQRDQEATEAEQVAAANKASAWRDSQIKQSSYQAEIDQVSARTKQAGPLAEATARQEVVVQETRAAQLEADLSEQRLQSQVRKPADAKAYETRTLADADRDAQIAKAQAHAKETELRAVADATSVKAAALAQAEATKARVRPRRPRPRPTVRRRPHRLGRRVWPRRRPRRPRASPRPRRSRPARPRWPRTRKPLWRRSSPRTGRPSWPPARRRSPTSTTWWCSTAPRASPSCSPRPCRWAGRASAWPVS